MKHMLAILKSIGKNRIVLINIVGPMDRANMMAPNATVKLMDTKTKQHLMIEKEEIPSTWFIIASNPSGNNLGRLTVLRRRRK